MMIAAGLGGPITGRGAHILLIDDYIKEIKEALSPSYRDYVWNWFTTVAYTRLEPGGSCVIIATRWHSDDLIGRILTNFPGQWNYIEFPALATEDDILGRVPGEALFPERYPIEELQDKKELLGSIFFEALYQQRPVDETKRIADSSWLRIVGSLPPNTQKFRIARIWDLAATEGGGDYTVGTLLAYDPDTNNCYILNVIRRQLSPGQVEEIVRQTAVQDGLDTEIDIEQEPGSAGKSLVAHYATTVLPEFRVLGVPVVTNKLIRAQPLLAAAEAGKLHLLEGHWNEAFKREFNAFPGEYDDQVDTAAAGYSKLSGKKIFTASWGRKRSDGSTQNSRAMRGASLSMQSPLGASSRVHGATFGRRSKAKTG
jgi:predicted phage terminase large subunit-like protein